ncbi:UNKNOWN [Stylonychia lemnae]|uniref:SecA DEAD-like N-terminal domain-containing protein n=1 Tax=Stylonychia lemnae TaxID=5949 RepID=A0A078AJP4_STYLE|nr:UNKNOWN [Stylonychia lemnae]|eukprot:CDW82389.1 UNKNOWN [Stylonychia lemnae]
MQTFHQNPGIIQVKFTSQKIFFGQAHVANGDWILENHNFSGSFSSPIFFNFLFFEALNFQISPINGLIVQYLSENDDFSRGFKISKIFEFQILAVVQPATPSKIIQALNIRIQQKSTLQLLILLNNPVLASSKKLTMNEIGQQDPLDPPNETHIVEISRDDVSWLLENSVLDPQQPLKQLPKGWKSEYKDASDSSKINRAKLFLKENDYNLDLLLQQFINNCKVKKPKSIAISDIHSERTQSVSIQDKQSQIDKAELRSSEALGFMAPLQMAPTIPINNGAIITHENIIRYIEKFINQDPLQRYDIISEIVTRNTQSLFVFLQYLENKNQGLYTIGMFNLLNEILQNFKYLEDDSKSRIFLASLKYYKGEILNIDETIIKDSMQMLIRSPNARQALGLSNYVTVNECETFSKNESVLKKLDDSNPGILQLMSDTWDAFGVDYEVKCLLPSSLFILNVPFIQVLKSNSGLALVRDIPSLYNECFIQICAFSTVPSTQALREYISFTRNMFLQKQEVLDQQIMLYFLNRIAQLLIERDPTWVGKVEDFKRLQQQIVTAQIEKGVKLSELTINSLLKGDNSEMQRILKLPRAIEGLSTNIIFDLLKLFETKNNDNDQVKQFSLKNDQDKLEASLTLERLQKHLGFKLYESQILCMNYIQSYLKSNHFIQFGIGNGKTLLSITLAIMISIDTQNSVFIVSKNEHLVQRDIKKYESLIQKMNLNCNLNQCSKALGIYFYTQSSLKKQLSNSKFQQSWSESIVIVDEYDWIFFDGSIKTIVDNVKDYSKAKNVIGFSGSELNLKEIKCLELVFKCTPVVFPTLDQLKGSKKIQRNDILISSNKDEYLQFIKTQIQENIQYCPVLIVASEKYSVIETGLKYSGFDFTSLAKTQAQTIEATIEGRYLMRNQLKQFGVYLMNESQGRGTDIQTNDEIESNGGSYLIIADVFSKRSEEQIIGRVGRLNTKGKWQRILYQQGIKDSAEQHILQFQQIQDLQEDKKLSQVQSAIEEFVESTTAINIEQLQQKELIVDLEETKVDKEGKIVHPDQSDDQLIEIDLIKQHDMVNTNELQSNIIKVDQIPFDQSDIDQHQVQKETSILDIVVDKLRQIPQLQDKSDQDLKGIMIKSYQASQVTIVNEIQVEKIKENNQSTLQTKDTKVKNKRVAKQKLKQEVKIQGIRKSNRNISKQVNASNKDKNDKLILNSENEHYEKMQIDEGNKD